MEKKIHQLATSIAHLQKEVVSQTLRAYTPQVEHIICTNNNDIQTIEKTLDALCDIAFDNDVLQLFKKLCRHYLSIDPIATAEYIDIYRTMWDDKRNDKPEENTMLRPI